MSTSRHGAHALTILLGIAAGCSSSATSTGFGTPSASGTAFPGGGVSSPPDFGPTRASSKAPPISGGTLAVTDGGKTAIVADPDRDSVYIVDLVKQRTQTIVLNDSDEPGRVVVDGARRAHVALRRGGAIATIDLATGALSSRRDVCPAPRGIAYDPGSDQLHVACATGELVSLPAAAGAATRTLHLDLDLRDVVVGNGQLYVSRFRSAEVLTIAADGTVAARRAPPDSVTPYTSPRVAWRMIPRPAGGGAVVVHQRSSGVINNGSGGTGGRPAYYSGDACSSFSGTPPAVAAAVTDFGEQPESIAIPSAVLPVDIAASPNGTKFAVVAAGNGHTILADSLFTFDAREINAAASACIKQPANRHTSGQLISVAWKDDTTVLAYSREPAVLFVVPSDASQPIGRIELSSVSVEDTGHAVFHSNTGSSIACASCHAEGGDDGLVWTFSDQGRRRTPSLKGTIAGTAPYHWSGDLADVTALVHKVYEEGMSGPMLAGEQDDALKNWLFAIPRPPASSAVDLAAAARGKALFEGQGGCTACHSGTHFTNNTTVDVGTGGSFQVPSLVGVSHRAPFLHTGCAVTLTDRFGACGGTAHGSAGGFSASQIADVVAYLSTL